MFGTSAQEVLLICAPKQFREGHKTTWQGASGVEAHHSRRQQNKTNPDGTEPRSLLHAPEMNFAKCCLLPLKQRCTDDCHFHLHPEVFFSTLSTCLKCNRLTYNLPRFLRLYFRKFKPTRRGQLKVLCFSCHRNIGHPPQKRKRCERLFYASTITTCAQSYRALRFISDPFAWWI